jgi:hypothetical protein
MDREAVIELIKHYLTIEKRTEREDYPLGIIDHSFIDLKFDGEVISSNQIE